MQQNETSARSLHLGVRKIPKSRCAMHLVQLLQRGHLRGVLAVPVAGGGVLLLLQLFDSFFFPSSGFSRGKNMIVALTTSLKRALLERSPPPMHDQLPQRRWGSPDLRRFCSQ